MNGRTWLGRTIGECVDRLACGRLAQRAVLLLLVAGLAGCQEDSNDPAAEVAPPVSEPAQPEPSPAQPAPEIVNNPPEISGTPAAAVQAGQTYSFKPSAQDADNDFLEFSVTNAPAWASFSDETGELSGTPGDADVGETQDITITVTDGRDTRSIGPFRIRIHPRERTPAPANTPPTISGAPAGAVTVNQSYAFQPSAADADGDRLTFSISNRPSWASFSSSTGRLSGTPGTRHVATYANIVISVSDGQAIASLPAFSIQVNASNRAPSISGAPATSVQALQAYSFQPSASDPDGDRLTFSISNRPTWASFDSSTGRLSGTPAASHAGTYANIVIGVSDGTASAALPAFSIEVLAQPNRAPTISGSPATSVEVGNAYSFTPTANDADEDTLGFSIRNKPSWATFDTASGRLSGTPSADDVGAFADIVISVSDSRESASLPAFAIAVVRPAGGSAKLSWMPPTQNTDGSALGNLAGFRIAYGTTSSALNRIIDIPNPGTVSYTIKDLSSGTWYFAVKAYTNTGVESELSNIASKSIP